MLPSRWFDSWSLPYLSAASCPPTGNDRIRPQRFCADVPHYSPGFPVDALVHRYVEASGREPIALWLWATDGGSTDPMRVFMPSLASPSPRHYPCCGCAGQQSQLPALVPIYRSRRSPGDIEITAAETGDGGLGDRAIQWRRHQYRSPQYRRHRARERGPALRHGVDVL